MQILGTFVPKMAATTAPEKGGKSSKDTIGACIASVRILGVRNIIVAIRAGGMIG